jgi:hypothetical protein
VRGWWSSKLRRTWRYFRGRVGADERAELEAWLSPGEIRLFDSMQRADRRHGLDVAARLRERGPTDRDLLVAGLLHDCGKGRRVRLLHRVAFSLGQRYGTWVWRTAAILPGFPAGLADMKDHAAASAQLAAEAGCGARIVTLILNQETPTDEQGRLLHEADETG